MILQRKLLKQVSNGKIIDLEGRVVNARQMGSTEYVILTTTYVHRCVGSFGVPITKERLNIAIAERIPKGGNAYAHGKTSRHRELFNEKYHVHSGGILGHSIPRHKSGTRETITVPVTFYRI